MYLYTFKCVKTYTNYINLNLKNSDSWECEIWILYVDPLSVPKTHGIHREVSSGWMYHAPVSVAELDTTYIGWISNISTYRECMQVLFDCDPGNGLILIIDGQLHPRYPGISRGWGPTKTAKCPPIRPPTLDFHHAHTDTLSGLAGVGGSARLGLVVKWEIMVPEYLSVVVETRES